MIACGGDKVGPCKRHVNKKLLVDNLLFVVESILPLH